MIMKNTKKTIDFGDLYDTLEALAKENGLTFSGVVRMLLLNHPKLKSE